ncbi:hypothetical protein VF21_05279 [Pseudogymnoascus sp. 05NY08]|nr:hypothetical protein VF21_05279 [Pseudogymnoascus sp. 05NY08]
METSDPQLKASNKNAANIAYRVTGIPIDYKQKQVKTLLQTALQLDKAEISVKLRSIAISPNRKTKVATVSFSCRPILLPPRADEEWHFPIPTESNSGDSSADDDDDIISQEQIITVDSHFKGITVLRSYSKLDQHRTDIIAISGLGGHAFGSFKARDGQHMWLCDSLPRGLPGAQIMIYGYDTQLHGSTSFQDLEALASSLRASIAAQRTLGSIDAKSRTVPLVFIAHSLGGLIVKEAIIQMKNDREHPDLLESIYSALFFGVPSQGMEVASLVPMVAGQPNQALLHTLGKESQLLRNQLRDFPKAFDSKSSEIFCYYETEKSRTAKLWLDSDLVSEHHGFIWIKGKPGSGKSTIMKHAVEAATNGAIPSIIIAFFFNARGTELERSMLGMYRSVLLQIVSKTPTVLNDLSQLFSSKIKHGEVYEWNIRELQAILITIMKRPQEYPVMWFIDALDQCNDDEVLKLVKFLENIGQIAVLSGSSLHICLSTRHYPNIPIQRGIQLTLEKQYGHDQDIMTYIDSEFRAPHSLHIARIKNELRRRSSGVFIWVCLVVELLNTAFRRGEGRPDQLQRLLDSVPEGLDDLFTSILKVDPNSKEKSILCFQWLLFSNEPLSPEELYFAVLAGTEPTTIGKWDTEDINLEGMENFILHISKGLMEVSKMGRIVQFIHESVRDFFRLHDGFTKLESNLATNVKGFSEERLKHCCCQYMIRSFDEEKGPNILEDILRRFPFALYAVRYVFAHAEVAQVCGIDQREFLMNFCHSDRPPIREWILLYNYVADTDGTTYESVLLYCPNNSLIYDPNDSLIYIFSDQNLPNLLLILIQNKDNINAAGKRGSPLQLAAMKGHVTIAQHLIAAGADIEFPPSKYEPTAFISALSRSYPNVAHVLLENGASYDILDASSQTPLGQAAAQGDMAAMHELLQLGDDMNIERYSALQAAAGCGGVQIVQLLLQSGANVNFKCGRLGNPLQAAASYGNEQIVQLLLQSGADVNSVGGHFGNALQAAAISGNGQVVQLLLQSGADVNNVGGLYGNALQAAAFSGNGQIVKLLLQSGADSAAPPSVKS